MTTTNNKKAYRTVSLKKYGSVSELTKTSSSSFSGSDGGSGLNRYAS